MHPSSKRKSTPFLLAVLFSVQFTQIQPARCAPASLVVPLSPESKAEDSSQQRKLPDPVTVRPPQPPKVYGPPSIIKLPPVIPITKPEYDARGVPSHWKHLNEQEWIVDSVGRDIGEILDFAARKTSKNRSSGRPFSFQTKTTDLASNKYTYMVNVDKVEEPFEHNFALSDSIWSTNNYEPLAIKLIDKAQIVLPIPSQIPTDFAKKLASCDMHVLLTENERVAKALTESPLDANLHEQAALLQAALGLVDLAGGFADTRIPLNRISAHLSLAKVLKKVSLTINGQVAEIALECLACRDGVAHEKAKVLMEKVSDPVIRSWLRAISIRATGDFRLFNEKDHTELEALEYGLRASAQASDYNFSYIQQHYPTFPVRWLRILSLGTLNYEVRNSIFSRHMKEEIADFLSNYNFSHKTSLQDISTIKGELNKTATRCLIRVDGKPALVPISWDDVAAQHCRQILWALLVRVQFLENTVSSSKDATATIIGSFRTFSDLTLWPFVLRSTNLGLFAQRNFFANVQNALINHPELVTKSNWFDAYSRALHELKNSDLIPAEKFFNPCIPFGTAYWYGDRRTLTNCSPTLGDLDRMRKLAPCDYKLCYDYALKKYGKNPTAAQWTEAFGPLSECNQNAMRLIARADANNPQLCIDAYKKFAAIEPAAFFELAEYCLINGRTDEAVAYTEEGAERCQDPIVTINNTVWLMKYYLSHDMMSKAKQLAERTSKHFARNGAVQLAAFLEKLGKLTNAEELLELSQKQYGHREDLCAFLLRNVEAKDKGTTFKNSERHYLAYFYPDGIPQVKLTDFKGVPQRGVRITRLDWMERSSPLQVDNVIVAIDGIPVEDRQQLSLATRLNDKDSATVIYWNGHSFAETEKKFGFSRDLNLGYVDYHGPRRRLIRKVPGRVIDPGDRSISAISPECFGANRCGVLGILYDSKRHLTRVSEGLPAYKAGLKTGDQILQVDKIPVEGMTDRELSYRITGLMGSKVSLTLLRDNKQFEATMVRQHQVLDEDLSPKE